MNICGIIGLLFSITGFALVIIASVVPRFVDVYVVQFADDINDSNTIAGVGVFSSFYDADRIEDEVVEASNVPDIEINSATPEFPLLFPVQEQFILAVLPLNNDVAGALNDAVEGLGLGDVVLDALEPIQDLVFEDDCLAYVGTLSFLTNTLFTDTQEDVLPTAIDLIVGGIGLEFTAGLNAAVVPLVTSDPTISAYSAIFSTFLPALGAACLVDPTVAFDAASLACFETEAANIADDEVFGILTSDFLAFLGTNVFTQAACVGLTPFQCFGGFFFIGSDDVLFTDVQTFGGNPNNICEALSICNAGVTTGQTFFFTILPVLLLETADTAAGAAVSQLFQLAIATVTSFVASTPLTAAFNSLAVDTNLPETFANAFEPCEYLVIFPTLAQTELETLTAFGGQCNFATFFAIAAEVLAIQGSDLEDLVDGLGTLYGGCFVATEGGNTTDCPDVFSAAFVSNALNFEFEDDTDFLINGVQKCEDTVVDNEKVEQAQVAIIASYPFFILAVVLPIIAMVASSIDVALYIVASVTSVLAGLLVIAGLLIVASAPVYDGVGEEPNEDFDFENEDPADAAFEIFFVGGPVGVLAFANGVLMIIGGACFVAAAVMSCRSSGDDSDVEFKEKQEMSPVAAAEPTGDKVAVTDVGTGENVTI